jgi:hypothetical protein
MVPALSIDRGTGSIRIGDAVWLEPNEARASIEPRVVTLLAGSRNLGNGYEWIDLRGLAFGGQPAALSVCFQGGRLQQAAWSVQLPDAPMEGGWPTRDAIESELTFVQEILAREMAIYPGPMPWGELWTNFDAKGFMAANGLRYRHS